MCRRGEPARLFYGNKRVEYMVEYDGYLKHHSAIFVLPVELFNRRIFVLYLTSRKWQCPYCAHFKDKFTVRLDSVF